MLYTCENPLLKMMSVDRLTWKGGHFCVPPRDYGALAYRISGSARLRTGNTEYFIDTNDVLYLPAGIGYEVDYTDTEIIVFHFHSQSPGKAPEVYTLENSEKLYQYFLQAHTLWTERSAGYQAHAISLFYKVLARLCEGALEASLPKDFLDAVSFINANFRSPGMTISSVCRHAALSETTFRQLFKKHYNKTPVVYITDLRLEHARNLIAANVPVATAAIDSGFSDPKYFARVVKLKYHCTPKDLKNYGK